MEQESLNPRCGKKSAGYIEVSKISPKIKGTADIGIVKKEEHIIGHVTPGFMRSGVR